MLRSKYLVGLILVLTLMSTLVAFSTVVYARSSEGKRAEKFVELAERAGEKVGTFIEIIYANETAIDIITAAGLYEELEANKTLFEAGMGNVTEAQVALEAVPPDYPGAIANATEALRISREVFKALNTILAEAGVERGELIDAQGLIEAMRRALDRIERIEDMKPPDEVLEILKSAREYLDVETAIKSLSLGRVSEVAWNLTQAKRLISRAFVSLKKAAGALKVKRIGSHLKVIEKLYNKIEKLVDKAVDKGLPGAEDLKDQLEEDVLPLIDEAKDHFEAREHSEAMADLIEARNKLKDVQRALSELRRGGPRG